MFGLKLNLTFLSLYRGHVRNSRKLLLIACIGLMCSLTIISSTNYYFDNSKKNLMDDYFINYSSIDNEKYFSSDIYISFNKVPPYQEGIKTQSINHVVEVQKGFNINYFKSITAIESLNGLFIPVKVLNENHFLPVQVVELDNYLYNELYQINKINPLVRNSTLNRDNLEFPDAFVVYFQKSSNDNIPELSLSSNFLSNLTDCKNCGNATNIYTVKVNGFTSVDIEKYIIENKVQYSNPNFQNFPVLANLRFKYNIDSEIVLFTSSIKEFSTILYPKNPQSSQYYTTFNYVISINFDYNKIDPFKSDQLVSTIRTFDNKLADRFFTTFSDKITFFSLNFRTQTRFQAINNILTDLLFYILLIGVPVLLVSIFAINYSFNLLNKNILSQIGNYKTRGASSWIIFGFQICDLILIMIISVIFALFSGIPLATLALKSDFLLSFNYNSPDFYVLNFSAVSSLLLYCAIGIMFFTNTMRIKRLSTISIIETERPLEKEEIFWEKHFLDFFLLLFGLITYLILYSFVKNPNFAQSLNLIIGPLAIIMIPAPICLVLGLILIINRIIPIIIENVGMYIWKKNGNLMAFSFKNLIRFKQSTARAIILISILIGFLIFFYSLPYSALKNYENNLYYQNGAEALATFNTGYNESDLNYIGSNLSNYLESYTPYVVLSSQDIISGNSFIFLLVNVSSYLNSAYLKFDLGLKNQLNEDFVNLKNSNHSDISNLKIILDKTTLIRSKSLINQSLTIFNSNTSLKLHIVDSFKNWPFIKSQYAYYPSLAIGDINFYTYSLNKSIKSSVFLRVMDSGIFINFKEGVNQTTISRWIEGNTTIVFKSLFSVKSFEYIQGIQFRTQVGQINNEVLISIIMVVIILIFFSYIHLEERRKEIYLMRSLGMKSNQIRSIFLLESIVLIIISIMTGLTIGMILTQLLSLLLINPLQSYPPYIMVFPFDIISITICLVISVCIMISIILAYLASKQEIDELFFLY